jgi:hypothetical protein
MIIIFSTVTFFTPPHQLTENKDHHEADNIRRTRFFLVIDIQSRHVIIKDMYEAEHFSHDTEKID